MGNVSRGACADVDPVCSGVVGNTGLRGVAGVLVRVVPGLVALLGFGVCGTGGGDESAVAPAEARAAAGMVSRVGAGWFGEGPAAGTGVLLVKPRHPAVAASRTRIASDNIASHMT